eukprot:4625100-Amphidinium_carterae.1
MAKERVTRTFTASGARRASREHGSDLWTVCAATELPMFHKRYYASRAFRTEAGRACRNAFST